MYKYKNIKKVGAILFFAAAASCTKLDQNLNSTLTNKQAADALGAAFVLQNAYNDIGFPYSDLGNIFALEEVPTDECLIPTRGGDWDDNGKWRALHQHTWQTDGVDVILNMFNTLNKIQFDATNVLSPAFKASKAQIAEAKFIRALALYQLLDLYGQFPFRPPADNLLNAPKVYSGDSAVQFIISELNAAMPDLNATNTKPSEASQDAAKVLLMKLYLNHGALLTRANPTWPDADMQQVITLGNSIIASNKYSYNANYFDNFSASNSISTESIFAYPNSSGIAVNNSGIHNRWWATIHYNQYQSHFGSQGGWNGFSTVAEFYNSFGVVTPVQQKPSDTLVDSRIGGRFYPGCTDSSGLRPGLLIGQQYDENRNPLQDRKTHALIFDPKIDPSLKETGTNLEVTGIRIAKYPPDYKTKSAYSSSAGNWAIIFRYSDVVLMVAEAKMRAATADNAGALVLVNKLRAARGAAQLASMSLYNPANVYDPTTLLAERGRELYWESVRRTDLIRFGMFLKPWAYKTTDDAHYLVFPIPTQALAANPNLKQNPGYN